MLMKENKSAALIITSKVESMTEEQLNEAAERNADTAAGSVPLLTPSEQHISRVIF